MSEVNGFWEPHSSSIDFCEPNYYLTTWCAELHNTWSSLLITFIAAIGLLYSNPTNEASVSLMFLVLVVIGLGSAGLHTSLHWVLQSADEIPMLWQTLSLLHAAYKISRGEKYNAQVGYVFIIIAITQTILYYSFQQTYAVFLVSMILYSVMTIIWSASLCYQNKSKRFLTLLWTWSFLCYAVFGFGIWIIDMNFCSELMSLYLKGGGATLHIFWHIFAAMGTYLLINFFVVLQLHSKSVTPKVIWILFLPTVSIDDKSQ